MEVPISGFPSDTKLWSHLINGLKKYYKDTSRKLLPNSKGIAIYFFYSGENVVTFLLPSGIYMCVLPGDPLFLDTSVN